MIELLLFLILIAVLLISKAGRSILKLCLILIAFGLIILLILSIIGLLLYGVYYFLKNLFAPLFIGIILVIAVLFFMYVVFRWLRRIEYFIKVKILRMDKEKWKWLIEEKWDITNNSSKIKK